jgi:hypothetical protein
MNEESKILRHLWDQGKHYDFFIALFNSVTNALLNDNELAPFLDKLKDSYPIESDLPGGVIDKEELDNLGLQKNNEYSECELILMNHYWAYIVKNNTKRHYRFRTQLKSFPNVNPKDKSTILCSLLKNKEDQSCSEL